MSLMKLVRWLVIFAFGASGAAACGARGNLSPGQLVAGESNGDTSSGGSLPGGGASTAGSGSLGAGAGRGGGASGGAAAACIALTGCDAQAHSYTVCDELRRPLTIECPAFTRCTEAGGRPSCATQTCAVGRRSCDASGQLVGVCSEQGNIELELDCGARGERCLDGDCVSVACVPNQVFCTERWVAKCNADGSASSVVSSCQVDQYCDDKTLSCQYGVCAANAPVCYGSIATTCDARGSGYLNGGVECKPLGRECVRGRCECAAGFSDCNGSASDGCEAKLRTDPRNCGACGLACSTNHITASCRAGMCDGTCSPGFLDCNGDRGKDGCESDSSTDSLNCGACANRCATGEACVAGKCSALLTFSGIKQNLAIPSLTGWSQCFAETYNKGVTTLGAIQQACPGSLWMLACRAKGSQTLDLAAYASRAEVLSPTIGNIPHVANGVGWYFASSSAWGFAPKDAAVTLSSCDTEDIDTSMGTEGARRLCWHLLGDTLTDGYRCGTQNLNGSTSYERVIYQAR